MRKVLIAIDYNPSAEKVAQAGYALAKTMQAEIVIVHVITEAAWYAQDYSPIMGFQGSYTTGTSEMVEDIKKEASNYLSATATHLGDPNISTMVLNGEIADAILTYAIEWGADLIVLGSHSHHGLDRLFSTDTVTAILKNSKVAVLAIPTSG